MGYAIEGIEVILPFNGDFQENEMMKERMILTNQFA